MACEEALRLPGKDHDAGSLAVRTMESDPRGEAEASGEAVASAAVAVAASEALSSEAKGEGVAGWDRDAPVETETQALPLTLLRLLGVAKALADALEHREPVNVAAGEDDELRVGGGEALALGEDEGRGELLRLFAPPREGEARTDVEARSVSLPARLCVGRREKRGDIVGAREWHAVPDADTEPLKEGVGSAGVAVAASEALKGEMEGEGVED